MNEIQRLQQLAGLLNEDVSDFNIGQSSETGGRRTTVTDIDPETQSVTWSVKKEVDDSTIHKDLTDLINKFEKVQLKDFHSRPKLIQLVKDLKSIRNKFSRTVVKEDLRVLKENLVGILNEIKVNRPSNISYTLEQLQDMYDNADTNNPNFEEYENELIKIGFLDDEGIIQSNLTDPKLIELSNWVENERS